MSQLFKLSLININLDYPDNEDENPDGLLLMFKYVITFLAGYYTNKYFFRTLKNL
jgi:hypothetical protein